jgi:hypothetical protein
MPGEPPPKPTPLVLALVADRRIEMSLANTAIRRVGNGPDGEDIARHVIELVLTRERESFCWNPNGPWSFRKYMFRTLRGVLSTDGRAARNNPDVATEDMGPLGASVRLDETDADRAERRELDAIADETERRLADDSQGAVPLAMLKASVERDYDDHADLARHLGCSLEAVRKGQRLITKYAAKLVESYRVKQRRPTK